ncbi:uncharacterized protein LOC133288034 [Gastrolobium bilobum]|uniref:uncharacterized protein LOC133288034 n=1 Tax=Gastrolobium bilobum TaxID=150636 RepID=UPI002AB2495E|nr:uncharacterized protein LOC133288034 [Gastrolobium bilobum]
MSCIMLRFPHARKAWKSLTSTLGKLRKIRRSKAMKKQRKHLNNNTSQTTKAPPKFLATKRFRHKRLATVTSVIYGFRKKPAPVYIDKLFKEPSFDLVENMKPQKVLKPRTEKTAKLPYQSREEEEGGTSMEGASDKPSTSDDMWESLAAVASPLMQGIDERAEEFIARFREQMAAQEMLARNL